MFKKRFFIRCLSLLLVLGLGLVVSGCGSDPKNSAAVNALKERGVIYIGVYTDVPGLCSLENGEYTGLEAELATLLGAQIMGSSSAVELVPVDELSRQHKLNSGEIDLGICMMPINKDNSSRYAMTRAYYTEGYAFLAKPGLSTSLSGLSGKTLGAVYGSNIKTALTSGLAENSLEAEVRNVPSYPEGVEMLTAGTLDALCAQSSVLRCYASEELSLLPFTFGSCSYGAYCLSSKKALAELADQKLAEMEESGELAALLQKYGL